MNLLARSTMVAGGLAAVFAGTILLSVPPADAARRAPAYVGKWASSAAACRSGDADRILTLRANHYHFFEVDCRFLNITGGRGVWNVRARCSGEGVTGIERMTIWAAGDRLTIRERAGGTRANYERCR